MCRLFSVDEKLITWYRAKVTAEAMSDSPAKKRINRERVKEIADPGATYAQEFYMNLFTLDPTP
ncbi:mitochondrial Homoaconitase [Neonectria magnoliae]|uniref:Mitochondrial Homoaconitase n=1 Tax=Neonectria magnoliae TaxID=2732573 RepID=A0ABR1I2E5_9HYPO